MQLHNLFTQIYSFHSFEMWIISYYKAVLVYGSSFKQIFLHVSSWVQLHEACEMSYSRNYRILGY